MDSIIFCCPYESGYENRQQHRSFVTFEKIHKKSIFFVDVFDFYRRKNFNFVADFHEPHPGFVW